VNGETWTEYAVRIPGLEPVLPASDPSSRSLAEKIAQNYHGGFVVGRTVTATPWLPVQDQP
jgi:hypothetical protein